MGGLTLAHDEFVGAALRGIGYIAEHLEIPDTDALQVGKEFGNRGQCNPTYFTVGNLVKHLQHLRDDQGIATQDIIDSGLVLQMRQGFDLLEADLLATMKALTALVRAHRDTVMPGRTFQQQAAPITFGFKAAIWLDELQRHHQRLAEVRRRALCC